MLQYLMHRSLILIAFLFLSEHIQGQKKLEHYVFFNRDRHRIQEKSFNKSSVFEGAQLKYIWKELEPQKDNYDFTAIHKDLSYMQNHNKKLFIQIQDVSFDTSIVNIPNYLTQEDVYHGGISIKYETDDQENILRQDGYVAKRWDPNVADRFYKLLAALGDEFDGKIAGICLPETAIDIGYSGKLFPEGFTTEKYRDAIILQMTNAKKAFKKSVVIQYANFMPGEVLPEKDKGYLESIYMHAKNNNIGIGGPDIKVNKWYQMQHSYKFLHEMGEHLTSDVAVQWGNYKIINRKTKKQVTIEEIYNFGKNYLKLNYIFWCTQEPYYSKSVIPFLKKQ